MSFGKYVADKGLKQNKEHTKQQKNDCAAGNKRFRSFNLNKPKTEQKKIRRNGMLFQFSESLLRSICGLTIIKCQ